MILKTNNDTNTRDYYIPHSYLLIQLCKRCLIKQYGVQSDLK